MPRCYLERTFMCAMLALNPGMPSKQISGAEMGFSWQTLSHAKDAARANGPGGQSGRFARRDRDPGNSTLRCFFMKGIKTMQRRITTILIVLKSCSSALNPELWPNWSSSRLAGEIAGR